MIFRFSSRRQSQPNKRPARRPSRRFGWTPTLNALEPRQLLAAGPLGINLAGTMGYVDLMKETRPWTPLGGAATLPLDSQGWPQADAQIIVRDDRVNQWYNGPDPNAPAIDIGGTYHLSFTGKATLSPDYPNNYSVQNQVYDPATNTTTAELVVSHNTVQILYIDFTNSVNPASSTGAGVSDVKVIQPGYAADTTQLFTTDILNDLKPFTTLRYLNIDDVNNLAPVFDSTGKFVPLEWSQRRLPDAASQTSGPGSVGQAWEYMVAMANTTNTDMWINVPGTASDDYVRQLANLLKNGSTVDGVTYAGLNSNLKVNLELSNEVWGGIFWPAYTNEQAAIQRVQSGNSDLTSGGVTDSKVWAQRYYLERTMEITNDFRSVFGADPTYTKVRPVLGWQEENDYYYSSTLPWFEEHHGEPRNFFYGMGNANYGGGPDLTSVDSYFTSAYTGLLNQFNVTSRFTTIATYYGLKNVAYEGGPGSNPANAAQGQVALAANRDPRMEDYINQLYATWYAAGGDLAAVYDGPYGIYTPNFQFPLVEQAFASNPLVSPKYRGILASSQADPQPVTAGTQVSPTAITTLPLAIDSLRQSFIAPPVGQQNHWLLNVPTAGNYTLTLQTPSSFTGTGQVSISLSDGTTLGTFSFAGGQSTALVDLPLHAGLNTLAITTLSRFTAMNLVLTPENGPITTTSGLGDIGFETVGVGSGPRAYVYNPQGSPWTFSGQSGLTSNNTELTISNPNAPQGQQVAFLQNQGVISQTFTTTTAGSFSLNYSIAQRAIAQPQSLLIFMDEQLVGSYTTGSIFFHSVSTSDFSLAAGTHLVTIKGLNASGDATAFLDNIKLDQITTGVTTPTATFGDSSFEDPSAGTGYLAFVYAPQGTPWNYSGLAGVTANNSAFTNANPNAPQGQQVAFIQNQGSISQSISGLTAGTYQVNFAMARRASFIGTPQTFQVLVDNQVIDTFTTSDAAYKAVSTATFTLTAGSHAFTFKGLNAVGDATAFLDSISLLQKLSTAMPPATTNATFGDFSFEDPSAGTGFLAFVYAPQGTPWNYSGLAGVTANNSAFTNANSNATQGKQVAFLQNQGSISQTISGLTAGKYHVNFAMARRASFVGSAQTFQVLIDNQMIGTFTTSDAAYKAISTATFTLTAGSHVFTFKGLNAVGDATALLDSIELDQELTTPPTTTSATFGDSSFEDPSAGTGYFAFVYAPQGTPWTYSGLAGVTANNSAFTNANPNAPQGRQVAFLQNQGSISQTISGLTAGTYHVNFAMARRASWTGSAQTFQVLVDNQVIGIFTTSDAAYKAVSTATFTLTAGSHAFTFKGLNVVGDATAFLDGINLVQESETSTNPPVTSGIVDGGFESVAAGTGYLGFLYAPSGSAWTYIGEAGITGNGTAFTNGNPNAPEGLQVGFLKNLGVISQVVTNMTAGNYRLNFAVAQRGNYLDQPETFQILIDDKVVMTYTTKSHDYQTITTPVFTVSAGSHAITFRGIGNPSDATAFLDKITLTQA